MIPDINLRPLHAGAHTSACAATLICKDTYASMQTHNMEIENHRSFDGVHWKGI